MIGGAYLVRWTLHTVEGQILILAIVGVGHQIDGRLSLFVGYS